MSDGTKLRALSTGDERQPLLAVVASGSDEDIITTSSIDPEEQRKLERPDELGWKSYTIYGILFVLGLLGLTLLIKGFIDTGDVEVRAPVLQSFSGDFFLPPIVHGLV